MTKETRTAPMDSPRVQEVRQKILALRDRRIYAEQIARESGTSGRTVIRLTSGSGQRIGLGTLERISMAVDDLMAYTTPGRTTRPQDVGRDKESLLRWFYARRPHLQGLPLDLILQIRPRPTRTREAA